MSGVLFVAYGLWCLVRTAPSPAGPKPGAALAAGWRWASPRMAPILSAGILFLVIWAAMYTAFGKYPGDWLAIPKAVKYWMGQHAIARIPGPWWYYFPQLVYYDTAILFAAAFAFRARDWRSRPAAADAPGRDAAPRGVRRAPRLEAGDRRPGRAHRGRRLRRRIRDRRLGPQASARVDAFALPAVRRVLGRRLARDLRVGPRESALADGPSAPAPHDPRRPRRREALGGAPPALRARGARGGRLPAGREHVGRVSRGLPVRGPRRRESARTRGDAGVRPDVERSRALPAGRRSGERARPRRAERRHRRRRSRVAADLVPAGRADRVGLPHRAGRDARHHRGLGRRGRARETARREVRRPPRPDPRMVVPGDARKRTERRARPSATWPASGSLTRSGARSGRRTRPCTSARISAAAACSSR